MKGREWEARHCWSIFRYLFLLLVLCLSIILSWSRLNKNISVSALPRPTKRTLNRPPAASETRPARSPILPCFWSTDWVRCLRLHRRRRSTRLSQWPACPHSKWRTAACPTRTGAIANSAPHAHCPMMRSARNQCAPTTRFWGTTPSWSWACQKGASLFFIDLSLFDYPHLKYVVLSINSQFLFCSLLHPATQINPEDHPSLRSLYSLKYPI